MPLTISDQDLQNAGLTPEQALVEFACRLFEAGRLTLWPAATMARLDRVRFENELRARKIPLYRPTVQDLRDDLEVLRRIGA
jgi:predicted HTH domain antitoxin